MSLIAVAPSGKDFAVMGGAQSYAEALRYAYNLRSYDAFEDARMVQIQGAGGREAEEEEEAAEDFVNFQIKVTLPLEEETEEESTS